MQPMPALQVSWMAALQRLRRQVNDPESDFLFDNSALDEFLSVVEEITESEPRLLRQLKFPEGSEADFEALLARVDQELASDRSYSPEKDGYESESDASFGLAASLKRLQKVVHGLAKSVKPRIDNLTLSANRCRERCDEIEAEEEAERGDYYAAMHEEHRVRSSEPFDVKSVFLDL